MCSDKFEKDFEELQDNSSGKEIFVQSKNVDVSNSLFNLKSKEDVRFLIHKGADVNATDKTSGDTVVIHSIKNNQNSEVIKELLKCGADINIRDNLQQTPLIRALKLNDFHLIIDLLKYGADVNIRDHYMQTPLHYARKKELVTLLVNYGAKINARDKGLQTPLSRAVIANNPSVVSELLNNGADPNCKDKLNKLPITYTRSKEITRLLTNHNNAEGHAEETLLISAVKQCNLSIITELMNNVNTDAFKKESSFSNLVFFATNKNVLKLLIENGANINIKRNGKTPLIEAVKSNNLQLVKDLLELGADPEIKDDETKSSPLHYANCNDMLKELFHKKADLNSKDKTGRTVLMKAVEINNLNLTRCLLQLGADSECRDDSTGLTAIHFVKDKTVLDVLIKHKANVNAGDKVGRTLLMKAIADSNVELAVDLLEYGADTESKDYSNGITALHVVKDKNMLEILMKNKANINATDKDGRTILLKAVASDNIQLAGDLLKYGAGVEVNDNWNRTAVHYVKSEKMVKLLLRNKADLNAADKEGETVLIKRVKQDFVDDVVSLLKLGANVEYKDKFLQTPLFFASSKKMVQMLLTQGAEIESKDDRCQTPLFKAVRLNNVQVLDMLLRHGANVNCVDKSGCIALHYANSKEVMRKLIKWGIFLNRLNNNYEPPLLLAVRLNRVDLVIELLMSGADVHYTDLKGRSLLHYANHAEIIRLLVLYGADINGIDFRGETPLFSAIYNNFQRIIPEILYNGANVNLRNNEGQLPIYYAKDKTVAMWLIQFGIILEYNELITVITKLLFSKFKDKKDAISLLFFLTSYLILNSKDCAPFLVSAGDYRTVRDNLDIDKRLEIDLFYNYRAKNRSMRVNDLLVSKETLKKHIADCICEKTSLKVHFIKDRISFFEFCKLGDYDLYMIAKNKKLKADAEKFYNESFPIFKDTINLKMSVGLIRVNLYERIEKKKFGIMAKQQNTFWPVNINSVCTQNITKYLENVDILNLILAFQKQTYRRCKLIEFDDFRVGYDADCNEMLLEAIQNNVHNHMIKGLLDSGANPNYSKNEINFLDMKSLSCVDYIQTITTAKLLLQYGASFGCTEYEGLCRLLETERCDIKLQEERFSCLLFLVSYYVLFNGITDAELNRFSSRLYTRHYFFSAFPRNILPPVGDAGKVKPHIRKCEEEISELKSNYINKNMSFFQLCHATDYHLYKIAKNDGVLRVIQEATDSLFPIYGEIIKLKLSVGTLRSQLLKRIEHAEFQVIVKRNSCSKNIRLINDCVYLISEFLSNRDIFNLVLALNYENK